MGNFMHTPSMICSQGECCKERIGWVKNGFALKMEDALNMKGLPQKSSEGNLREWAILG
jgi:hypothetical protein